MSFRIRLGLAFAAAAVLPLGLFALGARRESATRMEEEFRRRAAAMAEVIRQDLRREGAFVDERLTAVANRTEGDNRLRLALRGDGAGETAHLLDFAGEMMSATGLDALHLLDEDGRILSSGHYRNAYGRRLPGLVGAVDDSPDGLALATLRRPEGPFLALVRARPVDLGERSLWLVGGVSVGDRLLGRLSRDGGVAVHLEVPGEPATGPGVRRSGPVESAAPGDTGLQDVPGEPSDTGVQGVPAEPSGTAERAEAASDTIVLDRVSVPHVRPWADAGASRGEAAFIVAHDLSPLRELRSGLDRWLAWTLGGSVALALLLAWRVSARLSRPLESLATEARRLRLEQGRADFPTGRRDEIGDLARTLDETARRLRASAARLKEAERRATIGEIARQVNHDIRNGLAPLRNVIRHLTEVADRSPDRTADVVREREGTFGSALAYLEDLAGRYERISSRPEGGACDVNRVAREAAGGADPDGETVRLALAPGPLEARADPVALRRILDNLVRNGLQAVERGGGGRVTVATGSGEGPRESVRISVSDDGPGIPPGEQEEVFRDFYTTREEGTGLGLSIVRRLVSDLDGTLTLESEPGRGTVFRVEIPAAGEETGAGGAGAADRGREAEGSGGGR